MATRKNATATKAATKKSASKPAKKQPTTASKTPTTPTKMSQINAAIAVLKKARKPMNCKEMVEAMQVAGLWSTPNGATPDATLYASILREINTKGKDSRFRKTDRGLFTLASRS